MKEEHVKYLEEIAGQDKVLTDIEDKICFGFDSTRLQYLPDVIVKVKDSQQISSILKFATFQLLPINNNSNQLKYPGCWKIYKPKEAMLYKMNA